MQSDIFKQFRNGIFLIIAVIIAGTFGYEFIEEEFNLLDSLYMAVITISTTGFKEVKPLSDAGRIFTVFLIISGVLALAYTGGKAAQLIIEKQFFRRRKMGKELGALKDHYIVCGFGRMGRQIVDSLEDQKQKFVVIENDPNKIEILTEREILFVDGDATNDETLISAGLERAKGLVAVVRTDAENVFTTLSAKELNHNIFVVARAIDEGTESKLMKAGADRVVKPYELGGNRMVQLLLRPGIIDFIDTVARDRHLAINMEEITIQNSKHFVGKSLAEAMRREDLNIIIVSIVRADGQFIYNPTSKTIFETNDRLIAIGEQADLEKLTELCGG